MKKTWIVSLLLGCLSVAMQAQTIWHNPLNEDTAQVQGRAWNTEISINYNRMPLRLKPVLRQAVWDLSTNSAGLHINFFTNAPEIIVRYTVSQGLALPNMTTLAKSGLDLYVTDSEGHTDWCACPGNYHFGSQPGDTITFYYKDLSYHNNHKLGSEYRLFLPLYNTVQWLEIGIPEGSTFKYSPLPLERPIVAYGTSILQGASASRPGMAWTTQLQRRLDTPVYNLGFSGNAWMDSKVFEAISEIDAQLFIIDCMPNMYIWRDSIQHRAIEGVIKIRSKSSAPIILVENDGYLYGGINKKIAEECEVTNRELRKAYQALQKSGVKDLYYLTKEEIGLTPDAQVDGWHASDIGMTHYADACEKKIREILDWLPLTDFTPIRQRREPATYEWNERHEQVIARNRAVQPDILMIGNSITHYWGGEPYHRIHRNQPRWNQIFRGHIVTNMGFGWDRIENVLWRIYHGEIDDVHARDIFIMIGTNNLSVKDSPEKVAKGIVELVEVLKRKQPQAHIHVMKIFPRKDMLKKVNETNRLLEQSLSTGAQVSLLDLTQVLTQSNGQINPNYFGTDGLHPNQAGYDIIGNFLESSINHKTAR